MADPGAGIHGQGQSLCGRAVVLRVGLRGATVCHGNDHVFRRVGVWRHDASVAGADCLHAPELDRRHAPASLAQAFALLINEGSTGVWAQANDGVLTITARIMGSAGNGLTLSVECWRQHDSAGADKRRAGGRRGWRMAYRFDVLTPRINRAARDWSQSFYTALNGYGIEVTASFSTELGNGDPSVAAGIAQRYPDGSAMQVNTPALQTNFSPASLAFWQQVYLDMANVMDAAGVQAYLQFGEVQWWYFCPPTDPANGNWTPIANGGMPFYDAYTTATFQSQYGRAMHVFTDPSNDPTPYPQESAFLPGLIGQFTAAIMAFVRQTYANAQFEVLYPPDTNNAPLTSVINLPAQWAPANLDCFKTENFTYTGDFDLNAAVTSIDLPMQLGFTPADSAHLVGIGNYTTPWAKEARIAEGSEDGVGGAVRVGPMLPDRLRGAAAAGRGSACLWGVEAGSGCWVLGAGCFRCCPSNPGLRRGPAWPSRRRRCVRRVPLPIRARHSRCHRG